MTIQFSEDLKLAAPPRWIETSDARPADENAIALWAERVTSDSASSVYMHPALALSDADAPALAAPYVYADWTADTENHPNPSVLAVLSPRKLHCAGLPGFPTARSLSALKLTGDQILFDKGEESVVRFVRALSTMLNDGVADCAQFEEVEVNSPLWLALTSVKSADGVKAFLPLKPQRHWWIDFPADPSTFWKTYPSKTRHELRRRAKKLSHDVLCVTSSHQVPEFLEKASTVAAATWQAKRLGGRLENTPEFRRRLEKLADLGALRSYILQHDERPLAYMFAIHWNRCLIGEETGYDLEYLHFSPGKILMHHVLNDLAQDATTSALSFGFGDAQYKSELSTRSTMTAPIILAPRKLRPMLALAATSLRHSAGHRMREMLKNSRMLHFMHRHYRR